MPIEQMNISLSPRMAKFIRGKVKGGHYTNISEVVRDAIRHMQEADAARADRARVEDFEAGLTKGQRAGIRRGVRQGILDMGAGRYEVYDADGLRGVATDLAAASARKLARGSKTE